MSAIRTLSVRVVCWIAGHQWFEKSYMPTDEWRYRRTRECLRCGSYEEEVG